MLAPESYPGGGKTVLEMSWVLSGKMTTIEWRQRACWQGYEDAHHSLYGDSCCYVRLEMNVDSRYSHTRSLQTLGGGHPGSGASASGHMTSMLITRAQVAAYRCVRIQSCDIIRFTAASSQALETYSPCQLPRIAVELLRAMARGSSSVVEVRFD
jgi:hypothetical protein